MVAFLILVALVGTNKAADPPRVTRAAVPTAASVTLSEAEAWRAVFSARAAPGAQTIAEVIQGAIQDGDLVGEPTRTTGTDDSMRWVIWSAQTRHGATMTLKFWVARYGTVYADSRAPTGMPEWPTTATFLPEMPNR